MTNPLIYLAILLTLGACTAETPSTTGRLAETEEQEEKNNAMDEFQASGSVLQLSEVGLQIVKEKQGKFWARYGEMNEEERAEQESLMQFFSTQNIRMESARPWEIEIHLDGEKPLNTSTMTYVIGTNKWQGKLNWKWDVRVTCLPLASGEDCDPQNSSVIEFISSQEKWSSGKAKTVGFLYGQTIAVVEMTGNLEKRFKDYQKANLTSVVALNPGKRNSKTYLQLIVSSHTGPDLIFYAVAESALSMKWDMQNQEGSGLFGFSFLGGGMIEVIEGSDFKFSIYDGRFGQPEVINGEVLVSLERPLFTPYR